MISHQIRTFWVTPTTKGILLWACALNYDLEVTVTGKNCASILFSPSLSNWSTEVIVGMYLALVRPNLDYGMLFSLEALITETI